MCRRACYYLFATDIKDGIIHHSLPRFEGASNWNIFHLRDGIDIIGSYGRINANFVSRFHPLSR